MDNIDLNDLHDLKIKVEFDLFANDPIVRKCLEFYRHGDIPYENALLAAIIYLSHQSKIYEHQLIEFHKNA